MLLKFENHLPLAALDVVTTGQTGAWGSVTFSAEARSVKYTDAVAAPAEPNAWCYIRAGSPQERASALENYLGPVLNVERGRPLKTVWINKLPSMDAEKPGDARSLAAPPINPLPMDLFNDIPQFRSMNYPLGVVTHLHGGKAPPTSDGWPLHPAGFEGNPFGMPSHRTYFYPNDQRAAMLWFHDHGMDNTAQQVHAGLAGLYFVRDESDADIFHLIGGETQELPLVIQDRCLEADGAHVNYRKGVPIQTDAGTGKRSFKRPEFLGDAIFVNGRPWPHVHVNPKVYRLRLLNGSNARTYALTLADPEGKEGGKIWYGDLLTAIGNDGGLFGRAEALAATDYLLLAPGERLDLLLDLTQLDPAATPSLNLVNLALAGYDPADPEGEPIFQTDADSALPPGDAKALAAIGFTQQADGPHANLPLANVLQFKIVPAAHAHGAVDPGMPPLAGPAPALDQATLNKILRRHADDDSFHWDAAAPALVSNPASAPVARNRFVLLMNDTAGLGDQNNPPTSPYTGGPWRDTQIWELRPSTEPGGASNFVVPFDAKLADPTQKGASAAGVAYQVARAFFFEPEDPTPPHSRRHKDPLWSLATENVNPAGYPPVFRYAHLYRHAPGQGRKVIQPTEGTYERWYVANIGNDPGDLAGGQPDMHPFHMHLVNFVVTSRYKLGKDAGGGSVFQPIQRRLDFDGIVRHDTVRVQSNELVELLVHFPEGYAGRYPYHCHLVEHEDMGMMLHFDVQPRPGA
jgi:FtsP/CotA-like multicopper oxidase with cupredoxin domain